MTLPTTLLTMTGTDVTNSMDESIIYEEQGEEEPQDDDDNAGSGGGDQFQPLPVRS